MHLTRAGGQRRRHVRGDDGRAVVARHPEEHVWRAHQSGHDAVVVDVVAAHEHHRASGGHGLGRRPRRSRRALRRSSRTSRSRGDRPHRRTLASPRIRAWTATGEGAFLVGRLTAGLLWPRMLTFAQLSDPHLSSPAPVRATDLLGKRALGYLSWRLARRHRHLAEVLAALVQDLRAAQADHVVVTGDLTHLGLPHEFEQARRWLDALGPAPALSVVPGNHDAYARSEWRADDRPLGAVLRLRPGFRLGSRRRRRRARGGGVSQRPRARPRGLRRPLHGQALGAVARGG